MSVIALFTAATKLAGVLLTITVAANAFSFSVYRRKNLKRFHSPINDSADVLAHFNVNPSEGEKGFFFGLATAPAHVEDRLDDAWLQFAENTESHEHQQPKPADAIMGSATGDGGFQQAPLPLREVTKTIKRKRSLKIAMEAQIRGFEKYMEVEEPTPTEQCRHNVAAWHNVPHPEERLRFWSDPDTELKLAKDTGVQVFRMGVDWSRIMLEEPLSGLKETETLLMQAAIDRAVARAYMRWSVRDSGEVEVACDSLAATPMLVMILSDGNPFLHPMMVLRQLRIDPNNRVLFSDNQKRYLHLRFLVNFAALERYKWIINRVRSYGMKVMLTLFHHSLPPWAGDYGGWKLEKTVDYFMEFTRLVVDSVADLVDYWITFNEPHVFCMLTYCAGAWPGGNPDMLEVATSALPMGVFNQTMNWIAIAHSKAYDYIHEKSKPASAIVGVAHHVSFMRPYGLFDVTAVSVANSMTLYPFLDSISDKMDYIGINYYGQEVICGAGLKLVETDEYSESGRGVYPDGLFRVLLQFDERYKHLNLPFIITENGVSDGTDLIRQPYLLEHLLATYAAMIMGVRVLGYLFWTISDNWEWADGYGPKFGLVAVDRANNLARIPRPSYNLFSKVVESGKIMREDREQVWGELQTAAKEGKRRPFYRSVNKYGLMYAGGLDEPIWRPYIERDWRFGHHEMEGLQDPLSRFARYLLHRLSLKKKAEIQRESDQLTLEPLIANI
ncbi:Beta-glucosidase-like sfr2, chloroplastic [Datura stramonium]|uniref:Beta-glucosidase-like sfr2, chloroplastic n=1 Tax=Datura stramonium TaxID=4076 RepID=A0ABS8RJ59_DATST|nr:Beta-glucosidase-like sfr2, chloroplastic [Datura stramonium]